MLQAPRVLAVFAKFSAAHADLQVKDCAAKLLSWLSRRCVPGLVQALGSRSSRSAQLDAARAMCLLCGDASCFSILEECGAVAVLGNLLTASEQLMEVCIEALAKLANIKSALHIMWTNELLPVVSALIVIEVARVRHHAIAIAVLAIRTDERYAEAVCSVTPLSKLVQQLLITKDQQTVASVVAHCPKEALAEALACKQASELTRTDPTASQTGQLKPQAEQPDIASQQEDLMVALDDWTGGNQDSRLLSFRQGDLLVRL